MKGLGWKIFGLLVSIGLIIGGLSGRMVLRGTNSSTALVVAGVAFLAMDIFKIATHGKAKQALADSATAAHSGEQLSQPAHITVTRVGSMLGAAVAYRVYLNGTHVGNVKNGKQLSFYTSARINAVAFFDHAGTPFGEKVMLDIADGGQAEIFVKAGRVLKDRTVSTGAPSKAS